MVYSHHINSEKNGVVFDGKINWLDDIVDVSLHPSKDRVTYG